MAFGRRPAGVWDQCRRTVDRLDLPDPFDAEAFVLRLAGDRGRPIELLPVASGADLPCGLVITTRQSDWILYRVDTSELHRQHILLHEAAHLLCGHSERADLDTVAAAAARVLMPHLPADLVRGVLGRTVYSDPDEREAELLASLILYRVGRRADRPGRAADQSSRLDAFFGILEG